MSASMRLSDHFERVAVISLPAAKERRVQLGRHLAETGLGGAEVQYIPALPGTDTPPPRGWQGLPAWGCLRSHCAVLRHAMRDGVESVLILEDDAVFDPSTSTELGPWLQRVPPDWGQIYLGGEHVQPPRPTALSGVVQGSYIITTHAYAVSRRVMPVVLRHLSDWGSYRRRGLWHVDQQYGLAHLSGLWAAYAPAWSFAGQAGTDASQIDGGPAPERWWQHAIPALDAPFVHLEADAVIAPADAASLREQPLHEWDDRTLADPLLLLRGLERAASSALSFGALPAWRDVRVSLETVARLWPAGALRYSPGSAAAVLARLRPAA